MRLKQHLLGTLCNRLVGRKGKVRVALVGSQGSGKTVFLTSLVDHLVNHDPDSLCLGDRVEIVRCQFDECSGRFPRFPYSFHRSTLVHDQGWPAKTEVASALGMKLEIQVGRRGRRESVELEFLDFPGERSADFLMYGRNYGQWSDRLLEHFGTDIAYGKLSRAFFEALATSPLDEAELLRNYKLFLGEALCRRYSRMVTPSTFLLDLEGCRPERDEGPAGWASGRSCGLNAESEFVPLDRKTRELYPELARKFAARYRTYRRKVVDPLLEWLAEADQMLLFLDLPGILMGGASMYNDELAMTEQVLDVCEPQRGSWSDLWRVGVVGWLLMKPARISRVGVVATKSDLVAAGNDVDNLLNLARLMIYKRLRGLRLEARNFFTCASVVSTDPVGNLPRLNGRLVYDEKGGLIPREQSRPEEYAPSRVPEFWPADDQWQGYSFPEVYPQMPARRDTPPRQEGIERILKFILK